MKLGRSRHSPAKPAGGVAAVPFDYAQVLVTNYGASEVWPLVDITSGTAIKAKVNSTRNGTLTGWSLQNGIGPFRGELTPYSNGTSNYGNILTNSGSVGLVNIFNANAISIFGWAKRNTSWVVGNGQRIIMLQANGTNFIQIYITNVSLHFRVNYGGTNYNLDISTQTMDWFSYGLTIDKTADKIIPYLNGVTELTQGTVGTWSGNIALALIGAASTVPANVWDGWLAYATFKFGTVWTPTQIHNMHSIGRTLALTGGNFLYASSIEV